MTDLRGTTTLVGLLGDPVAGSLSPRMQNAAFAAVGLDWAYVPLPVAAEGLADAVRGLVALGFAGANVTIPHKRAVVELCDELDPVAERAGSVNTLVVREGRVLGSSTDGEAVTGAIELAGARCLVLGAGGAAQAVIA
ncbi:MAG: shikimate dehydrogenase, partial [Actinobacteria bacterium]|nr:shikimate dehydrogenase [Actinomycetota bacterium]